MSIREYLAETAAVSEKFSANGAFLSVQSGERFNLMTISWWNAGFIWQRPIFTVAVRPTRFTFALIERAEDFTVSIPVPDLPKALGLCGSRSGKDTDKLAQTGLHTRPARRTKTPVLDIPGLHFECRIVWRQALDPKRMEPSLDAFYPGKDYHTVYFGEIMESYRKEAAAP